MEQLKGNVGEKLTAMTEFIDCFVRKVICGMV